VAPDGPAVVAWPGRKRATTRDETLLRDLDALVEPTTPDDPDSPLRWTTQLLGHRVSHATVGTLLHELGYSPQGRTKVTQ